MSYPCNPLIEHCGTNIFFRPFSFPEFPNGGEPDVTNGIELEASLFLIELEDSTDLIIQE